MTTVPEVIEYIYSWRTHKGISGNEKLTQELLMQFVNDLQTKIKELSFTSPNAPNANVIPFSGARGAVPAWKIAKERAHSSEGKYIFIGDVPAGQLLYDEEFVCAITMAVGEDEDLASKIITGK